MKFPHCRAKVKVRFRTGGENCTVLRWTTATRIVRAGVVLFLHGGKAVRRQLPVFLKKDKMKRTIVALALGTIFTINSQAGVVSSFGEIQFWTGSGASESSLVIQWNDSKSPLALAWGFNWSSASTVNDMLLAVMSVDVRLFARGDSATGYGASYFGFGYNNSGNFSVVGAVDQFGTAVTPVFTNGLSDMNTDPTTTQAPFSSASAAPANSVDRYAEGWNDNGFWDLYTGTGLT